MNEREQLRSLIFEIVDKQLLDNTPPEVRITYDRLLSDGYTEFTTRQLLGQCVIMELHDVMISQKPFNEVRYVSNLRNLPKEPKEAI